MQRILVMGSSGSGKSTFTRRLSDITGIPMGLRPGQVLIHFTDRAQADQYLTTVASAAGAERVH